MEWTWDGRSADSARQSRRTVAALHAALQQLRRAKLNPRLQHRIEKLVGPAPVKSKGGAK